MGLALCCTLQQLAGRGGGAAAGGVVASCVPDHQQGAGGLAAAGPLAPPAGHTKQACELLLLGLEQAAVLLQADCMTYLPGWLHVRIMHTRSLRVELR
jgi:hypothetical protein